MGNLQSPSVLSLPRRRVKSLSRNVESEARRLDAESASGPFPVERSKRVSKPDTWGRKKGARSAALGASLGLFRCWIISFESLFEREKYSLEWYQD
jgi:hypothetical protein